jgi:glutathione synthase/RimK-type ligase-like ATP-grasp enzyme
MRILLTEGAGLTSRQVATHLDGLGHLVSAAVSDPVCLARFTRHVRALPSVPAFGRQPMAWFDRLLEVARQTQIDVVFPTQEQVAVLSHQLPRLVEAGLATAVPPFASLVRVQDKVSARCTLEMVGIPQPASIVVRAASELASWTTFPAYVKAPIGTGSTGVARVLDGPGLAAAFSRFAADGALDDGGVLVQEALCGTFVMAQCVFDAGTLVAFHAVERVREGANGSASAKVSVEPPRLRQDLARLGRALAWHGGLSVDAIVVDGQPFVIDVNARLVEPANALAAGTDLVAAFLDVALGWYVAPTPPSLVGVRTHQFLMAVLGAGQRSGRRRDVLAEIVRGAARRGVYANSVEELLPLYRDWRTIMPAAGASLMMVLKPDLWRLFTDGAVSRYALTAEGWHQLRHRAPLDQLSPVST